MGEIVKCTSVKSDLKKMENVSMLPRQGVD